MATILSDAGVQFVAGDVQPQAASPQIETITTSVASNNLTISWGGGSKWFRNSTLSNGTPTLTVCGATTLVIPSGATLGAPAAITSASATMAGTTTLTINTGPSAPIQKNAIIFQAGTRIGKVASLGTYVGGTGTGTVILDASATFTAQAIVIINPARLLVGVMANGELFVINQSGGVNLDETGFISTTAISAGATANNVAYSTTARTNQAYRLLGYIDIAEPTVGAYSVVPELVQGATLEQMLARWAIGNGQTWADIATTQRVAGQTYRNIQGRPITLNITGGGNTAVVVNVNGINTSSQAALAGCNNTSSTVIPAGATYSVSTLGGGIWAELS